LCEQLIGLVIPSIISTIEMSAAIASNGSHARSFAASKPGIVTAVFYSNRHCSCYSACTPTLHGLDASRQIRVKIAACALLVARIFTSKNGNTFLNIGAAYPNQTFTGWIPNSSPVKDSAVLDGIEGKHVKITGRIEMYKGKPD
jgi:hypothetical protein